MRDEDPQRAGGQLEERQTGAGRCGGRSYRLLVVETRTWGLSQSAKGRRNKLGRGVSELGIRSGVRPVSGKGPPHTDPSLTSQQASGPG